MIDVVLSWQLVTQLGEYEEKFRYYYLLYEPRLPVLIISPSCTLWPTSGEFSDPSWPNKIISEFWVIS